MQNGNSGVIEAGVVKRRIRLEEAIRNRINRLLKNSLRGGQAYNYLRKEIMPHASHGASLVASARFSAAC
jgi:hypothetical protein